MVKLGSGKWISRLPSEIEGGAETLTRIGLDIRVDVRLGGEVRRIARVIDRVCPLIHSDPIDRHGYREW